MVKLPIETVDYGSRDWGDFKSIGNTPKDLVVRGLESQVLLVGKSQLCPDPPGVVREYTAEFARARHRSKDDPKMERLGMLATRDRYSETNSTTKVILESLLINNPELFWKVLKPVKRVEGEMPDPSLDRRFLPPDFDAEMRFASTVPGYCWSRNVLVLEGEKRGPNGNRTQKNILTALKVVDRVARIKDKDPIVFTAKLARELVKEGADPKRIIYHTFSFGILKEQGCKTMFKQTQAAFKIHAGGIWNEYQQMIRENGIDGMHRLGILVPTDLE